MTGAVMFITDVLYQVGTTYAVAIGAALAFLVLWYRRPAAAPGRGQGPLAQRAGDLERPLAIERPLEPNQQRGRCSSSSTFWAMRSSPSLNLAVRRRGRRRSAALPRARCARSPSIRSRSMRVAPPAILPTYSGRRSPRNSSTSSPSPVLRARGRPGPGAVGERQLAAGHASSRRRRRARRARSARAARTASRPARRVERRALAELAAGARAAAGGSCSRRSTVAPWSPKNSSTRVAHAGHGGEAPCPPARAAPRARARARGAGRPAEERGAGGGPARSGAAGSARSRRGHRGREVGRRGPVELARRAASAAARARHRRRLHPAPRSRSSARERRDFTVPRRQPSAAAVSSSESSSK